MKLHDYQNEAVHFLRTHRHAALFADPGLGKTVIVLTWYSLAHALTGEKALIIAPLRVASSTWPDEVEAWPHTRHLKCQVLHGKTKKIDLSNDLFFMNPEGLPAFFDQKESEDIRLLVVDESSKFKNWSAQRTKLLRKHAKHFLKRIIMTGTPAPNGLLDLFSQAFLVDLGEAFGKSLGRFKETYFHAEKTVYINGRSVVASWAPNQGASEAIEQRMAPFTLRLDGEKLLSLPAFVETDIRFDLPDRAKYEQMEKELFAALDDGEKVLAKSAGAAYSKLRQLASGFIYDRDGVTHEQHDAKTQALSDLLDEIGPKPVLIVYNYQHELVMLRRSRPGPAINGDTGTAETRQLVDDWNADRLPVLYVHPASVSHGLNMQKGSGRHIIWFSLTDDLEAYLQLNRRIRRQGVTSKVFVYHLIAKNTVEVAIRARLRSKETRQTALMEALEVYRQEAKK